MLVGLLQALTATRAPDISLMSMLLMLAGGSSSG